jgi:hypothetical protein
MNFITRYYKEWSERRFLKKHGCETREQYDRKYDPDVVHRATRIKNFYHGYPYFCCFENHQHEVYYWDLGIDGIYIADKWCKKNLKGKFRFDFHRVMRAPSTANEWEVNELGGGDHIFFACQDPKDYTLFLLRWA